MGTPVETAWPELEPLKWYRIAVDIYSGGEFGDKCDRPYDHRHQCCLREDTLQGMIDAGAECVAGAEYCIYTGFSSQRLIAIHGPYTTNQDCIDSVPPE